MAYYLKKLKIVKYVKWRGNWVMTAKIPLLPALENGKGKKSGLSSEPHLSTFSRVLVASAELAARSDSSLRKIKRERKGRSHIVEQGLPELV